MNVLYGWYFSSQNDPLLWSGIMDAYVDVPNFYDTYNALSVEEILTKNGTVAASADAFFRLVLASSVGEDNTRGCVNRDTLDLTIYPRPSEDELSFIYSSGNNLHDEYCLGASVVSDIEVNSRTALPVTFRWYSDADPVVPNSVSGVGASADALGTSATQAPVVSLTAVNTYHTYASQVLYAADGFAGCESFVDTATVVVIDAPQVDFEFRVNSADVDNICVGDATRTAYSVSIVPTSPSAGTVLETGDEFTYDVSDGNALRQEAFRNLFSTRRQTDQEGSISSQTLSSYDLARVRTSTEENGLLVDHLSSVGGSFSSTTVEVEVYYKRLLPGGDVCENSASKVLSIHPLPRVSIADFANKHCRASEVLALKSSVNTVERQWSSVLSETGQFRLEGLNTPTSYVGVPDFETNSLLSFDEVYNQTNLLPLDINAPETDNFRLIFESAPSQDNALCVNRDTLLFTVYPGPLPPTVAYASGQSEDQYCKGSTVDEVSITNARATSIYTWYDTETSGKGTGSSEVDDGNNVEYEPKVTVSVVGTHTDYVSETRYADAPFLGCESALTSVNVVIVDAAAVDFEMKVSGNTLAGAVCVADAVGAKQSVSFEPKLPSGFAFATGSSVSLLFESAVLGLSGPEKRAALSLIISDQIQTSVPLSSPVVEAYDLARIARASVVSSALDYTAIDAAGYEFEGVQVDVLLRHTVLLNDNSTECSQDTS